WRDRAVHALPDPRYVCADCGGESAEWRSLCPHCGAFDTLAWRTPARTGFSAALPALVEAPAPADPTAAPETALPAAEPRSR
ncbi:MAG: hypothetical protein WA184_18950, partial [Stellaceae bacterium]